jgi:Asp-tRNA(Asn)/Glu-tRNA(Gln) amidotransferase A subunit family amidase
MADLTPDAVAALAGALGLPAGPDDITEVTHRLNALLEALAPLIARPFDEATLLRAAHAFEQQSEWSRRRPPDTA